MVVLHGAGKGGLDGLGVVLDQANSSGAPGSVLCVSRPVELQRAGRGEAKYLSQGKGLGGIGRGLHLRNSRLTIMSERGCIWPAPLLAEHLTEGHMLGKSARHVRHDDAAAL